MPGETLIRHFFNQSDKLKSEERFDLSRKSRSKRLREIYAILVRHHFLSGVSPEEFRLMLEELGPTFVKIGQTLSTRSEILPKAYCDELSKLQNESNPLPFDEVVETIESIFGEQYDAVFAEINPIPLGSASLAQVHKAHLVAGDIVAVKVQRPGVKEKMAQDIGILRSMVRRVSRFAKGEQMINFTDIVEEMWTTFLEETDFEREAENLVRFRALNADVKFIDCPHVYMDLCSERCLVMEYVEGIPIYDHERLKAEGYDLEEMGAKILDNYATQILDHGFFHADPHPGNILVRDGKVVYIDLGIMGRVTPAERAGFSTIIEAVGLQDPGKLKDALLSFAEEKDTGAIDHSRMLADLDLLLASYGKCDVKDLDIGQMLTAIIALARTSKLTLPSSITNVSRGIVTIEGTVEPFIANDNIVDIINGHIIRSKDPFKALEETASDIMLEVRKASEGSMQASAYAGEAMRMLTRGQLKVNMEVLGSEEPLSVIGRIMNRLALGIIVAGLFIGSSMYSQSGGEPFILGVPFIPFFGYLGSFVLSAWVVIDIFRKR